MVRNPFKKEDPLPVPIPQAPQVTPKIEQQTEDIPEPVMTILDSLGLINDKLNYLIALMHKATQE